MTKLFVVPLDGSKSAMRSLSFLMNRFGLEYDLKIALLHILPGLPDILVEESANDPETKRKLKDFQDKNLRDAEKRLLKAKRLLAELGYADTKFDAVLENCNVGISRDICAWAREQRAEAIVLSSSGHSGIDGFYIGEVATKLVEFCRAAPIFLVKGTTVKDNVLLAVDDSENAVRAAKFTSTALSSRTCRFTVFHSKRPFSEHIDTQLVKEFPSIEQRWEKATVGNIDATTQRAKNALVAAGVPKAQVAINVEDGSASISDDILHEAERMNAGLIVVGCKGLTNAIEYSIGSTTNKVVNKAENMTVCLVP